MYAYDAAGRAISVTNPAGAITRTNYDAEGNVTEGEAMVLGGRNDVVLAGAGRPVAVIGLDDVIVVDAGDAVLVCRRDRAQDVRKAVDELVRRAGFPALSARKGESPAIREFLVGKPDEIHCRGNPRHERFAGKPRVPRPERHVVGDELGEQARLAFLHGKRDRRVGRTRHNAALGKPEAGKNLEEHGLSRPGLAGNRGNRSFSDRNAEIAERPKIEAAALERRRRQGDSWISRRVRLRNTAGEPPGQKLFLGKGSEPLRGRIVNHDPVAQNDYPVGAFSLREIMRDVQDRAAFGVKPVEIGEDRAAGKRAQHGGRFVEQKDRRGKRIDAREGKMLFLP